MRKLCAFAVPFCAAVFAAVLLLPEGALLPAAALCALPALSAPLWRGDARLRVVLIALGAAAGLLWTGLYGAWRIAPALALDRPARWRPRWRTTPPSRMTGWPWRCASRG